MINQKRAEQIVSRVYGEYVHWLPLDCVVEKLRNEREALRAAGVTDAELLELAHIGVWRILHDCVLVEMPGARHVIIDALCLAYGVKVEYRRAGQHLECCLIPLPREAD